LREKYARTSLQINPGPANVQGSRQSQLYDLAASFGRHLRKLVVVKKTPPAEVAQDEISRRAWSEERALLMAMINQVPDYLFVKDTNSRFLMANTAVARDIGLASPEQMVGQSDFEHHSFEVAQGFAADDRSVMQSGRPKLDIEEFMIDASGAKKWLSTSKVPLRNDRNEIIGLIGVARDITRRKEAEEAGAPRHVDGPGQPQHFLQASR